MHCPGQGAVAVAGRIVQKTDFERMLTVPARQRSTHFAVHHLPGRPAQPQLPARLARKTLADPQEISSLSTGKAPPCTQPVDDLAATLHWLGTVVPKRHARRATTRNLLKRQIRSQFQAHSGRLPAGLWVVRLKAPFAKTQFPSARSAALAVAVREELSALLHRAVESGRG
jgi:ribonuclease P protein component